MSSWFHGRSREQVSDLVRSNIRSNQATAIALAVNMVSAPRLTRFDTPRVKASLPAPILLS
jgi:hypothetical protein